MIAWRWTSTLPKITGACLRAGMSEIAAVILAAGLSRRMGQPKMALPWGDTTVIGQVVRVLAEVGARPLVVVTGGAAELVGAALVAALGEASKRAATRASMRAATRLSLIHISE